MDDSNECTILRQQCRTQRRRTASTWLVFVVAVSSWQMVQVEAAAAPASSNRFRFKFPGRRGFPADDDASESQALFGTGREFSLFDTTTTHERGTSRLGPPKDMDDTQDKASSSDNDSMYESRHVSDNSNSPGNSRQNIFTFPQTPSQGRPPPLTSSSSSPRRSSSGRSGGRSSSSSAANSYLNQQRRRRRQQQTTSNHGLLHPITDWWEQNITPNIKAWPRLQCRVEPTTTLKIRKTFRPLKTVVRFGADFNTQLGVWQFKSSWEDAIIGGKLTLIAGRELQLTKSWALSVGGVDDLVTRLRFRAAVDLQTWKAYARVGFRTERLSPINVMEGFTLVKRLPLDGQKGHIKMEVKANLALPEPEIEYSTETQRSLIGMGDIQMNIEELNLVLDY